MPRRRVTMLEAFQVSARQSIERAAQERRRAADERRAHASADAAARRADGGASQVGPSVEPGAADPRSAPGAVPGGVGPTGVGSMWASLGEAPSAPAAEGPVVSGAAPVDLDVIDPGSTGGADAADGAAGPPPTADAQAPSARGQVTSGPSTTGPSTTGPSTTGPSTTAEAAAALDARLDRGAIKDAIEAAADAEFAVPMRARTFVALAGVALLAVFALGFTIGRRAPAEAPGDAPAAAAGRDARVGGFALPAPPGAGSGARAGTASAPPADGATAAARTPAAPQATPGTTAADRAFRDPANEVSVLAIRYRPSEANIALAWEAYDQLQAAGLPVVSPVHLREDRMIYLFVGAAETRAQLEGLLDRVKRFEFGPRGLREFASAQIDSIDRYR